MHPILFESFWGPVPSWHLFFCLGGLAGYWLLHRLSSTRFKDHFSHKDCDTIFMIAYCSGYLGSRIFAILAENRFQGKSLGDFIQQVASLGAMTLYGGLSLAVFTLFTYAKIRKKSPWVLASLVLPPFLLSLSIGRIGCLLNGDDYGHILTHPRWWGVHLFFDPEGVERFPVQALSSLLALLNAFACILFQAKHPAGLRYSGVLGLSGYAISRFFIEYLRADYRGGLEQIGLSTSQIMSLTYLTGVSLLYLYTRKKSNREKVANPASSQNG